MSVGHSVEYEPLPDTCRGCRSRNEGPKPYCRRSPHAYYGAGWTRERVEKLAPDPWECQGYERFIFLSLVRDSSRRVTLRRLAITPVYSKIDEPIFLKKER